MKTIVEPKESIDKLWGKQKVREGETYRLMRYVLRVDHEDKVLLHNVVTGRLVVLEQEEAELLETLPAPYAPAMEQLVTEHYLVPQNFDEYRSVNQLRKILRSRDTSDIINRYVVLPTTYCNARCFYCYESDYPRVHMTEETANRLVEYIDEHRKGKDVRLNWFGGEPLLGISRIDQISQGLKDRDISFSSSMISNGYLFDDELIEKSVNLWKLQRIQITLDGTEEVYNRVKAYVNVKDNPFQRVLRNIDLLSAKKVKVTIRLNVDFYNRENIHALIEELGHRYAENKYVSAYLNMLFSDQGYEPVHHTTDDVVRLLHITDEYNERLKELKIGTVGAEVPSLQANQCVADNPHAVVIQPDGSFCRCEHESIHDSYGSIDEGILDPQKIQMWKETIERSDDCPRCSFFPSCYMLRYCIGGNEKCIDSFRLRYQKLVENHIRSVYVKELEDKKNESVQKA
ncbi:MAG: radical SAM protein [Clostridia bacterium]|nr:radical SAM protein [Clostridia bacterium]